MSLAPIHIGSGGAYSVCIIECIRGRTGVAAAQQHREWAGSQLAGDYMQDLHPVEHIKPSINACQPAQPLGLIQPPHTGSSLVPLVGKQR